MNLRFATGLDNEVPHTNQLRLKQWLVLNDLCNKRQDRFMCCENFLFDYSLECFKYNLTLYIFIKCFF